MTRNKFIFVYKLFFSVLCMVVCCPAFVRAATYSYTPQQLSELKSKLNRQLLPGDVVYLEDGIYTDFQVSFIGNGTENNPIILQARNAGAVVLTGKLSIRLSGEYLAVSGLVLKDGEAANGDIIEFRSSSSVFANHCRLTNCVIDNCNNPDEKYRTSTSYSERWVMLYGRNNQIDHCYFVNKINGGVIIMANLSDEKGRENNHLITHNFFGHHDVFAPGNNAETIRIGDSNTSQYSSKTIVSKNFFYQCDGETEIISIKSCDNIIENNTFYESRGGVVCRHGHRNTIRDNLFIGNQVSDCAGIRVINEGHKIYGNFLQEIKGTKSRSALCIMTAMFETPTTNTNTGMEPLNAYHRVKNVDIYENTFVNCASSDWATATTYTYASDNPYYPGKKISGSLTPQDCRLYNNLFYNPTVSTMLVKSGNTSGIISSGNLYYFNKPESTPGFIKTSIVFKKKEDGAGKGLYFRTDTEANTLPEAATPTDCGTPWYPEQQSEMTAISVKTIFPDNGTSVGNIRTNSPLSFTIIKKSDKEYQISSSSHIKDIQVYSLQGVLLQRQAVDHYTGSFYFPHTAGMYIIRVGLLHSETAQTQFSSILFSCR